MTSTLKYVFHSKKGLRRDRNQDKVLIIDQDNYYLFLVFDGVSSISTSRVFINNYSKIFKSKIGTLSSNGSNLGEILFEVHNEVKDEKETGMSTLSLLFFNKLSNEAKFVNIGDSRIYLFTNKFIEKVTIDDSLHEKSNILTKWLGSSTLSIKDFEPKELINKYNFLLCTDGFYHLMMSNLKTYFEVCNFKNFRNIEKKFSLLQRGKNNDDSSYILIKNEICS